MTRYPRQTRYTLVIRLRNGKDKTLSTTYPTRQLASDAANRLIDQNGWIVRVVPPTPKRQSTTSKITRKAYYAIVHYFASNLADNPGLIVRYKGKEYGVVGASQERLYTLEGVVLFPYHCTIRKGTLASCEADMGLVFTSN